MLLGLCQPNNHKWSLQLDLGIQLVGWFCAFIFLGPVGFGFRCLCIRFCPPVAFQNWETWVLTCCSHLDPIEVQKVIENQSVNRIFFPKLAAETLSFWQGASRILLVEVCCLWVSYNVVQAVKSDCPVSYHLWATAVYVCDILDIKRVLCNFRKCVDFCVEFGLFVVFAVVAFFYYF